MLKLLLTSASVLVVLMLAPTATSKSVSDNGPSFRKGQVYTWARREADRLGIRGRDWKCLSDLVTRENAEPPATWNPRKPNGSGSSAYGLPQALPGSKMGSEGADWEWNPVTQIRWMIGYAKSRYKSVCGANYFQLTHNYY